MHCEKGEMLKTRTMKAGESKLDLTLRIICIFFPSLRRYQGLCKGAC